MPEEVLGIIGRAKIGALVYDIHLTNSRLVAALLVSKNVVRRRLLRTMRIASKILPLREANSLLMEQELDRASLGLVNELPEMLVSEYGNFSIKYDDIMKVEFIRATIFGTAKMKVYTRSDDITFQVVEREEFEQYLKLMQVILPQKTMSRRRD